MWPKPKPAVPMIGNNPGKPKPGTFGKPEKGNSRKGSTPTFKQAVMGRSKIKVRSGEHMVRAPLD